jgi:hypothetical protein
MRNGAAFILIATTMLGCSSSQSVGNDAGHIVENPFAGTWTCPYSTNSGYTATTAFDFTVNTDGTLASTTSALPSATCTLTWSVSGSTASVAAGTSCGSFTVTSFTFTLNGTAATFTEDAIEHGMNQEADGGFAPIDLSGSVMGTCTQVAIADGAAIAPVVDASASAADGSFYGVTLSGPSCQGGQLMLIQETAPTYGTPSCVECFNSCQAMCQSTCLGYYECYCGCDPHNGQCPIDCQADASTYCQGCVTAGVDLSCFASNCSTVCCVPSGQSCGTAPGHGCCTGTCTNGTCQ